MTTQQSDQLIFNGEEYEVKPFPLREIGAAWCSSEVDGNDELMFAVTSTDCRRGYTATWAINNDRLYLTRFDATAKNLGRTDLSMLDVFGTEQLFAFWYSGELHSPIGEVIYGMFEPTFEQEHVWEFEKGVLKKYYVRTNRVPERNPAKHALEQVTDCKPPFWPALFDVLDQAVIDGAIDTLSELHRKELLQELDELSNSIVKLKSQFMPEYDCMDDPEFEAVRDAWQFITRNETDGHTEARLERMQHRKLIRVSYN